MAEQPPGRVGTHQQECVQVAASATLVSSAALGMPAERITNRHQRS